LKYDVAIVGGGAAGCVLASRLAANEVIPRADLEEFVDTVRTQLEKAPEIGPGARH